MREILFRAWAKHTVNNKLQYAMEETKKEYDAIEPNTNYTEEWDIWYDDKNRYYEDMRSKWNSEHDKSEEYTETFEMITDIMVNGKVTRPYGYEIIDVMQFTGLCDKNGKKIFEGDIVVQPVRETRTHSPCEIEFHHGKFMAHYKSDKKFFDRYYDINSFTKVIGNIHDKE